LLLLLDPHHPVWACYVLGEFVVYLGVRECVEVVDQLPDCSWVLVELIEVIVHRHLCGGGDEVQALCFPLFA
jgi:hypothetical protein